MANTKANRKADPKKTKNGKVRLFGLRDRKSTRLNSSH